MNPDKNRTQTVIALGANLPSLFGEPRETLQHALSRLAQNGVKIAAQSRWYKTAAWPSGSGPDYTNACAEIVWDGAPLDLLSLLQRVELALGRVRSDQPGARWSARVCDLDLLFFGAAVIPSLRTWQACRALAPERALPDLVLPHPRLHQRSFVLAPLCDVAPEWCHPVLGRTARQLYDAQPQAERAEILAGA